MNKKILKIGSIVSNLLENDNLTKEEENMLRVINFQLLIYINDYLDGNVKND